MKRNVRSVAFVYAGGRSSRLEDTRAGRNPTEFYYGGIELERDGYSVQFVDAVPNPGSLLAGAYNRILSRVTPVRLRGEHLLATSRLLRRLQDVDAVVATASAHAFALGVWKQLGRLRTPLVGIHCGIVNYPLRGVRRSATCWALRNQTCVLFADSELAEMTQRYRLRNGQVVVNSFGVDAEFWRPVEARERGYVLSVGNDARRDFRTLVEAARGLDWPVRILTSRELPEALPDNVELIKGSWHAPTVTDADLRELYCGADAVVVPLEDSLQPSGQSVALQAMSCGRPVVMTRTQGLWTGDDFRDGEHLHLVHPNDASALRSAIGKAVSSTMGDAARARVIDRATALQFAEGIRSALERDTNQETL